MRRWFYSLKSYLIINDQGGIISVKLMTTNVNDRKLVPGMANEILGCLCGDKGYIYGPLEQELADRGVTLRTGIKNMKPKVMKLWDRLMLRKLFII
uniref:transposase n=1 Tax=Candidatus Enterovibrio escicola TaxID=1927127 RepID=UPI00374294A9